MTKLTILFSLITCHNIFAQQVVSKPSVSESTTSAVLLKEVKINSFKSPYIALGDFKTKYLTRFHTSPDQELAQYIPNQYHVNGKIISVSFDISDDLNGIDMPFKVELLAKVKGDIFPDTSLIKENIIVYNPLRSKHVIVDIAKYEVNFPENGLFVVFQTCDAPFYDKSIIRYDSLGWIKTPGLTIYLVEKNYFDGECCDVKHPDRDTPYCLFSYNRTKGLYADKRDNWVVYKTGISLGIGALISVDR